MSWNECPKCSRKCRCLDTRFQGRYVRRRYKCVGPKQHVFTTSEMIVEASKGWYAAKYAAATIENMDEVQRLIEKLNRVTTEFLTQSALPDPTMNQRLKAIKRAKKAVLNRERAMRGIDMDAIHRRQQ